MQTLISIMLFTLCINGGMYLVAYGLDLDFLKHNIIDFESFTATTNSTVQEFGSGDVFANPLSVFTGMSQGITIFINMISGGYLIQTILLLGLGAGDTIDTSFLTVPLQAIILCLTVFSLVHLFTGRGDPNT